MQNAEGLALAHLSLRARVCHNGFALWRSSVEVWAATLSRGGATMDTSQDVGRSCQNQAFPSLEGMEDVRDLTVDVRGL